MRPPSFRRSKTRTGPNRLPTQFLKMRNYFVVDSVNGDTGGSSLRWHYMAARNTTTTDTWSTLKTTPDFATTVPFGWTEMQDLYSNFRVTAAKVKCILQTTASFDLTNDWYGQILNLRHDFNTAVNDLDVEDQRTRFCDKKNKWIMSNPGYFDVQLTGTEGQSAVAIKGFHQTLKTFVKPTMLLSATELEVQKEFVRHTDGTNSGTYTSAAEPYIDFTIESADGGAALTNIYYMLHFYVTYYIEFSGIKDPVV